MSAVLAFHEFEVSTRIGVTFGCASHKLLTMTVRYGHAAELLKEALQAILGKILKLLAQLFHVELKLWWHSIKSDHCVQIGE